MSDPSPEILKVAISRLGRSMLSRSELLAYLASKGYDALESEKVVSYLERRTIVNDRRTIDSLIESKSGKRSVGIEKLRATLQKRGLPEEQIEEALAQLNPGEAALDALAAKFKPSDRRDRAARFLAGRGFDEEEVANAIDRFFGPQPFSD